MLPAWGMNGAGAVHGELKIEIHLPTHGADLVAGTDDIVGSDGDAIERAKVVGTRSNRLAPKMGRISPIDEATSAGSRWRGRRLGQGAGRRPRRQRLSTGRRSRCGCWVRSASPPAIRGGAGNVAGSSLASLALGSKEAEWTRALAGLHGRGARTCAALRIPGIAGVLAEQGVQRRIARQAREQPRAGASEGGQRGKNRRPSEAFPMPGERATSRSGWLYHLCLVPFSEIWSSAPSHVESNY